MSATPPPDRYAVIGHPVAHSLSPGIHARFARQTGQVLDYERVLAPLDGFAATVRGFAAGAPPGRGCNVTVPFKFEALALVREAGGRVSERAALAGAANTLGLAGGDPSCWWADNTDGVGLVRDIERELAQDLVQDLAQDLAQDHARDASPAATRATTARRVLLVGAGGAAAGVLGPLIESGAHEVVVANRSRERAEALAASHAAFAAAHGVTLSARALATPGEAFDLVVNATSTSLVGAAVPVPDAALAPGALAVDLMYGAAAAPFLAWARGRGARARDGLGMLVEQAAEAFFLWRGVRPETAPVLAALRAELDGAGS